MSSSARLLLFCLLLLGTGNFLLLERLGARLGRQYSEAAEEPMVDTARILAALVEQQISREALDTLPWERAFELMKTHPLEALIYSMKKTAVATNVYITDEKGVVRFDSAQPSNVGQDFSQMRDVALTLRGEYGARSSRSNPRDPYSSTFIVAAPIYRDARIVGVLSVMKPESSMEAFREETVRYMQWLGWLVYGATASLLILAVAWFTRPIHRLMRYVQAIQQGQRPPTPTSRNQDMRELGQAFERMRDALEDRAYVRNYVQTLTHELKSPVSAIRGAAELLESPSMPEDQRRRFLANIQSESARLQRGIDQLLALTTVESQKSLANPQEFDLAALLRGACEGMAARGVHWRQAILPSAKVWGEEFLIETALTNLLQNAADFSPPEGQISVKLESMDGRYRMTVEDEGPGIPDYALGRVFERFYSLPRPNTGRKSSGLGLCFVREAAELHGGQITLENRQDRPGTRAVLELPAR